ncbi:Alpha-N-acetylgalactosaminidase [Amphibalanus amphitrite]|uniref:Alpha-galactosidase n=1 Tax=Amphibalanus amphitrite TaxID=1232801 RepID=A0A6A4WMN8_AMPAM|nr:Alpha-N-acetylgalactosaminidase [Amphibalanus amphitrite]
MSLSVSLLLALLGPCLALDNGLARTPPMGWLTWERFRCNMDCVNDPDNCISENLMKAMADRLAEDGYAELGYKYVIVDDCWLNNTRDGEGRLQPDKDRFPGGMAALGDYIHGRGLLYGIYEDIGSETCAGYPGLQGHFQLDAQTFAEWGADYLKIDGCNERRADLPEDHAAFGAELAALERPIVYSCEWPFYELGPHNYTAIAATCNLWRNTHDVQDHWESVVSIARLYSLLEAEQFQFAGPGGWFDPDMLIIGDFGLTLAQSRVQMALWAIWAAPLIMSNDLRAISAEAAAILQNADIIAVDQDELGVMGRLKVQQGDDAQLWARPVLPRAGDATSCAVAAVNYGSSATELSFTPALAGCAEAAGGYRVRELYSGADGGLVQPGDTITASLPPTDALIYTLTAQ